MLETFVQLQWQNRVMDTKWRYHTEQTRLEIAIFGNHDTFCTHHSMHFQVNMENFEKSLKIINF